MTDINYKRITNLILIGVILIRTVTNLRRSFLIVIESN